MRGRVAVAGEQAVLKAETCAAAMAEAGRLIAANGRGRLVRELLVQTSTLLDELDEIVLVLAHDEDRAVFAHLESLRATLNAMNDHWHRTICPAGGDP